MNRSLVFILLIFSSVIPEPVLAHGSEITYSKTIGITVKARYDDGTPMANSQTVVYAPNNPEKPWLKGITDNDGSFTFTPDRNLSGNWDVKVRQGGHGGIVSIPVEFSSEVGNELKIEPSTQGYTLAQKLTMAGLGIWGFIGTALFFSRKSSDNVVETDGQSQDITTIEGEAKFTANNSN